MSNRNSVPTPWRQGWYIIVHLIVASAYVLMAAPVTRAEPVAYSSAKSNSPEAQSRGAYLDPGSTLTLPTDQASRLDPPGFHLVSGLGETPRSAPNDPEAVPGDENWIASPFSVPGMNDDVQVLVLDTNGNLYAGGYFTTAGGMGVSSVARWNGNSWSLLGGSFNNGVFALALDAEGNVYAGGAFTIVDGTPVNHIAKWNGSTWSAVGGGTNQAVFALAFDSTGNLYAGGRFTSAGGVAANFIARWNGSTWSSLGSGMNGWVKVLSVSQWGLYAGGFFTAAGGVPANYIAHWEGTFWTPLGRGMNGSVEALAIDTTGQLYAGGVFTVAGTASAQHVAKWNGTWSRLDSGTNDWVVSLVLDAAGNLYAGGRFTTAGGITATRIAKWNGIAWLPLGSGTNSDVLALVVDRRSNLYAGGEFTSAGNQAASYVAQWTAGDGTRDVTTRSYTFYVDNLPVTIRVVTRGWLYRLTVQRFNRNHQQASSDLLTGFYWEIVGTDVYGNPATGYTVDLTLPTTFTPDDADQLCRFTGSTWDCAGTTHTANSITRTGITQLSDWTVANRTQEPLTTWNAEAEQGTRSGGMAVGTDSAASACQYVADATANSGGAVTFNVELPHSGLYYLWARVEGMGWNNNSFFVSVNGAPQLHYEVPQFAGTWNWGWDAIHENNQAVVPFYLNTGINTVRFQTREANARLDRVFLVNRTGSAPTMVAPCTIPHSRYVPFVPRGR